MTNSYLASILISFLLLAFPQGRLPFRSAAATGGGVLAQSDITCIGMFLTPGVTTSNAVLVYPVAYRYESGVRHYFIYGGDQHVYEFPEPTLVPCDNFFVDANRGVLEGWGGDWGVFNVSAADGAIPGGDANTVGLNYDSVANRLMLSWLISYSNATPHNAFASADLDTSGGHALVTKGCWGVAGRSTASVGSGAINIPASFVSTYLPAGQTIAVGLGGPVSSVTSDISQGPAMRAVQLTDNACTSGVDTLISSNTLLSAFTPNTVGPTCSGFVGLSVGCTPVTAPTNPHSATINVTNYSLSVYETDWDPYAGIGYMGIGTWMALNWYDDGVKRGVVVPYTAMEGWARAVVQASPAPTVSGSTITWTVDSVSTNDGLHMNPTDIAWVDTCVPGVGGCLSANGQNTSIVQITSVNTSTKAITATVLVPDNTGTNAPVVGGLDQQGCLYTHGSPTCSRGTFRMQIYNPDDFGAVAQGSKQPYDVTASSEFDLSGIVSQFGTPSGGSGVFLGPPGAARFYCPTSVMVDPDHHQFMLAFNNAGNPPGRVSDAVYLFLVAHPAPFPLSPLLILSAALVLIRMPRRG